VLSPDTTLEPSGETRYCNGSESAWHLAVRVVPPGDTCRQWHQRRLAVGGMCPPPGGGLEASFAWRGTHAAKCQASLMPLSASVTWRDNPHSQAPRAFRAIAI